IELAAHMLPAAEVGGDYYDVLPTDDGCWIGIGDVAGHGLNAGLVMMMVQSVVTALVQSNPKADPTDHVVRLNEVLFENIRHRLGRDEHVTLSLLRYSEDGSLRWAGAHENLLVVHKDGGA